MAWTRITVAVAAVGMVLACCSAQLPESLTPDGASTVDTPTTDSATSATPTTAFLESGVTPPALSSAGAVFVEDLVGLESVWGHGVAGGVAVLPEEAVSRFNLLDGVRQHPPSEACRRALDDVLEASTQLRLWALKMLSSSVMLPDALLAANMYSLGDFDGCLSVPEAVYCLLDVEVRPARQSGAPPLPTHPGDEESPFEPPHGHNATLWDLLQAPLGRALAVELRLRLQHSDCTDFDAQHGKHSQRSFWVALRQRPSLLLVTAFLLAFPVLLLVASVRFALRDSNHLGPSSEKQGLPGKVLDCFAAQNTWRALCRHQKSQIHCIQGSRTINMIFLIVGHRLIYLYGSPLLNADFVEAAYSRADSMLLLNGGGLVAKFFVISGFLEARLLLKHYAKHRRFSVAFVVLQYVSRYLRLLPVIAVSLAIQTQWMQYMGSGPVWGQVAGRVVRDCQQYWWTHLLFVNNYVAQGSFCMIQTWFAAALLHMFLLTPPLMWLVSRWTQRALWPGCLLLGLLLAASAVVLYTSTVHVGLPPTLLVLPRTLVRQAFGIDPAFIYQYLPTHTNVVPYVLGLVTGTLFYLANRDKWQPSKRTATVLWLGIPLCLLLMSVTLVSAIVFFRPSFEARPLLDALYGPARLLGFSLPTAWIIFTCGLGYGGVFDRIFSWAPLLPLGRLSFSVYLIHITIIVVTTSTTRQPTYVSDYGVASQAVADVVISYAAGLVLHLCVEAPMMNVLAIAFARFISSPGSAARVSGAVSGKAAGEAQDADEMHENASTSTTNV
ncbi:O-acyltransferase like protein-like [Thrips palmi]|uniref:O-acyltransferase like protein-like n=1 Tax=Thrips palmi TaxID=161013 RepID=A0A6P8Z0P5_THRPL|nr:O-acyltransferase like protein-like [Thrips palmi]